MKNINTILCILLILFVFTSNAQTPFKEVNWSETKIPGFIINKDASKTEVIFDTYIRTSIREIGYGDVVYIEKGGSKIMRSVPKECIGFQINDKLFEKVDFNDVKGGKSLKFMQPLSKGKINLYMYIYYSSSIIENGETKQGNYYYYTYFLRKTATNEGIMIGTASKLNDLQALISDNANVSKKYQDKEYNNAEVKEGVNKNIDLIKMINDYNSTN